MSLWPTDLDFPQTPDRDGFMEQWPANTIRSNMDTGPAKVRRRGRANVRNMECAFTVNGEQANLFNTFYIEDCASGTLPFTWKSPRTQEVAEFRFAGNEPPKISNIGGDWWRIVCKLEQLP